jgi:hypothetical protein
MTNRWGDRAMGWLLSMGIHVTLLLGTALVFIERLIAVDDDGIVCRLPAPRNIVPVDVTRDLVERKGTPSGEGERFDPFEESTFSPGATEPWLSGSDIIPIDDASGRRSSTPSTFTTSGERLQRNSEHRGRILKPGGMGSCTKPGPPGY